MIHSRPVEIISLGAGQGTKDFLILEELQKQDKFLIMTFILVQPVKA